MHHSIHKDVLPELLHKIIYSIVILAFQCPSNRINPIYRLKRHSSDSQEIHVFFFPALIQQHNRTATAAGPSGPSTSVGEVLWVLGGIKLDYKIDIRDI